MSAQQWTNFVGGIGQSAAEGFAAGGPLGAAASGFQSFLSGAIGLIGRGRREADIIVPVQNEIGNLLVQVNAQMQQGGLTSTQLIQLRGLVVDAYARFDEFTRDPRFVDGRASVQARDTIRPLVDGRNDAGAVVRTDGGTLGNLERLIVAAGPAGPGGLGTAAGGNNNALILAVIALVGAKWGGVL